MKNVTYSILIILLIAVACKPKPTEVEDFMYEYFPVEVGTWVTYDVIDTRYDVQTSSETYQLKEIIDSEIKDAQDRPALRIARYWRKNDNDPWEIKDIWVSTRTTSMAEKVEENVRYVKLVFPVRSYQTWDGNVYNTKPEWEYFYDSIGNSRIINNIDFDETVKVVQIENFNLIQEQDAYEIYAKDIGLIYRKLIDIDYSTSNKVGRELYQTVTGYGKN